MSHQSTSNTFLDEVSDRGNIATYKRIYGDWTDNEKRSWKNVAWTGRSTPSNSTATPPARTHTDSAMIIDAMDILYSGNVDGFCLVSAIPTSPSWLSACASRDVRHGHRRAEDPKRFRTACDTFKLLEIISSEDASEVVENVKGRGPVVTIKEDPANIAAVRRPSPASTRSRGPSPSF